MGQRRDVLARDLQQREPLGPVRPLFTSACTALTSELFPMPRAPHSSALLAGRPSANRCVFWCSTSRAWSIPLSSDKRERGHVFDRHEMAGVGFPDKGVGARKCEIAVTRASVAVLERRSDALQQAFRLGEILVHAVPWLDLEVRLQ